MSLSRPARFPLLKLPWLCIKCILLNSDLFDILYFATISNKTRRIVKSSNYPLKEIEVSCGSDKIIYIGEAMGKIEDRRSWSFINDEGAYHCEFVLHKNSQPFRNCRGFNCYEGHHLNSYTDYDTLDALKMGIDFLIDVFGCTIGCVTVDGNKLSELFGLGVSSVKELYIRKSEPVDINDLEYLLETVKVTDNYVFDAPIPANFSCNSRIFKCRRINFACRNSADWVTLEVLCQLDVSFLTVLYQRFSAKDIVSFITHWFNSESRNLEYVKFYFNSPVSLEDFKIDHLDPLPFDEKRRNKCPFVGGWKGKDMSSGKDILRQDGLLATFYVDFTSVIFYIWHKRFPDAVQHN